MKYLFAIISVALLLGCGKADDCTLAEEDEALVCLLNALDECQQSNDHETCCRLYAQIAAEYERKNMTDLQKHHLLMMLREAETLGDSVPRAEALQQLATAYMVEGKLDSASLMAHQSCSMTPADTLDFRAQTLLLLAQINLMDGQGDSVLHYTDEAMRTYPDVVSTDLYRLTHAYGLNLQGRYEEMMTLLPSYIAGSGIHNQAELTRLIMSRHAETGQWHEAYDDATRLMALTDSIAVDENSEQMARIHALQHERQMEHQRAVREAERAKLYAVIAVVLLLLLAASATGWLYRKKVRIAHARELEAMRLSEIAQANESEVREENVRLQRLYYEHLYAIILPILNANRGKSGHINLEESSWELIERNTDMVLPGFTSRLRKQHPALTIEDVRFCCLIMMRVPNLLLADVYGIAPSSIAVRKQRMKKKLDSDVQNQTIENYLNQYIV